MIKDLRFSSEADWLNALAKDFRSAADEAIDARGGFHVALSGGSTPRAFYLRLNQESLPWEKIEFWLGDERWVPPQHSLSNQKMISETLFRGLGDRSHFHSWHLDEDPLKAAACYEKELISALDNPPVMDLILLGIGGDGHVASLFPNSKSLEEKNHYTAICQMPHLDSLRLTLTFPMLNTARQVWFLVQGKEKAEMLDRALKEDVTIPAGKMRASKQLLYWLV